MAGCYGDSREDRHFESVLDKHLNEQDNYGYCKCYVNYHEDKDEVIVIGGVDTSKKEIEDNNDYCPECGEKMNIKDWF